MNELSLFSGAGGGVLASKLLGHKVIGYVEWEGYCQKIIEQRIKDTIFDEAPIFGDIREFVQSGAANEYRGFADVVSAGFPCQPFSVAGKRKSEDDERNMWPATRDVIRAVRPRFAFLENVPGLLTTGYFDTIMCDLAEMGMDAKWCVLGASDIGAPHHRKRLWIFAYTQHARRIAAEIRQSADPRNDSNQKRKESTGELERCCPLGAQKARDLPDSGCIRQQGSWWAFDPSDSQKDREGQVNRVEHDSRWGIKSRVGRVANGVAYRANRLKAIGNGQVPQVAATAFRILSEGVL